MSVHSDYLLSNVSTVTVLSTTPYIWHVYFVATNILVESAISRNSNDYWKHSRLSLIAFRQV